MRDSAYVWHNMMGGGTVGAFKAMLTDGLVNHYVENDEGFRDFVRSQDPMAKIKAIKKYRTNDSGFMYADTDEDMIKKFKKHNLL